MTERKSVQNCFGELDKVFPMGDHGLRESPESCADCLVKTECLKIALKSKEGVKVHEEKVDRSYKSGTMNFLERWARKKTLHNAKKNG